MYFTPRRYGFWTPQKGMGMGYEGFMGFPRFPESGMASSYGLSGVMGYEKYGLRGVLL